MTTVAELIAALSELPPGTLVVTQGYGCEGGYRDASIEFEIFKLKLNVHSYWYYGPHERASEAKDHAGKEVNAICI